MKQSEYIFGIRPILEAIDSGKEIEKLIIQNNLKGDLAAELKQVVRNRDIPVQKLPLAGLNKITRKNHQGAIAYLAPISYQNMDEIIISTFEQGENPLVLVLDHITDVRNLGAIARTAESTGVHLILLPAKGSAAINNDAIKTSAGALLKIPVSRTFNLSQSVKKLKAYGLTLTAVSEKTEKTYTKANLAEPTALIMGAEDKGISLELIKLTDHHVSIPMYGTIKSLNVSVATGIVLYEAMRQRHHF